MKKFTSLLMAVLVVLLMAVPVMAENYTDESWTQTGKGQVIGSKVTLDKYFVISQSADVLDVDFTFEVTAPTETDGFPTDGNVGQVIYAGIEPDKVKVTGSTTSANVGKLHFDNNDQTTAGDQNGENTGTKKYVKKQLELDFSSITFTEPGIYRYYLTESTESKLTQNDTEVSGTNNMKRTIDVYVVDNGADDHNKLETGANSYGDNPPSPAYSVVYVGHLTKDDLPKDVDTYSETEDFDITRTAYYDLTNDGRNWVWTDPDHSARTKSYAWDSTEKKWHMEEKDADGTITKRYEEPDDAALGELNDAYDIETFEQAKNAGIVKTTPQTDITNKTWTVTDDNGVITTYSWDSINSNWNVAKTKADGQVDEPDGAAFPYIDPEGNPISDKTISWQNPGINDTKTKAVTWKSAKDTEKVIISTLRSYQWKKETETDGVTETITYVFNTNTGKWDTKTTYSPDTIADYDQVDGKAEPSSALTTKSIRWEEALKLEKAAQAADPGIMENQKPNGVEAGEKSDRYVNEYYTQKLQVTKTVSGNQGSRDKYFEFTIVIDTNKEVDDGNGGTTTVNAAGAEIKVDWGDGTSEPTKIDMNTSSDTGDVPPNAATDKTKDDINAVNKLAGTKSATQSVGSGIYKIGNDGKATIKIYLQHGQKFQIKGIPQGAKYTVTETDYTSAGYKTSVVLSGDDQNTNDDLETEGTAITTGDGIREVSDSFLKQDSVVEYTNKKSGVIPTGVMMSVAGGAALVAIALAALLLLGRRRTRYE